MPHRTDLEGYLATLRDYEIKRDPNAQKSRKEHNITRECGIYFKGVQIALAGPFEKLIDFYENDCAYDKGYGIRMLRSEDQFTFEGMPTKRIRIFARDTVEIGISSPAMWHYHVEDRKLRKAIQRRKPDFTSSVGFWVYQDRSKEVFGKKWQEARHLKKVANEIIGLCEFGIHNNYRMCLQFTKPEPIFYEPAPRRKQGKISKK